MTGTTITCIHIAYEDELPTHKKGVKNKSQISYTDAKNRLHFLLAIATLCDRDQQQCIQTVLHTVESHPEPDKVWQ